MIQPDPKKSKVKVVEKKTTVTTKPKKSKTVSQALGDITLRDVKDAGETALNLSTLGGYGVAKKKIKEMTGLKSGGTVKKAKSGAKFDLNKDGKTTFKDVLIGRGVLPKTAKSGKTMKKAQNSSTVNPVRQQSNWKKEMDLKKKEFDLKKGELREKVKKIASSLTKSKSGGKMKKAQGGEKLIKSKKEQLKKRIDKLAPKKQTMKAGGSMKKCKYGCK